MIREGAESDYASLEILREKYPSVWHHVQFEAQGPWLDLWKIVAACRQHGETTALFHMRAMSKAQHEAEMKKAAFNPTLQSGPSEP